MFFSLCEYSSVCCMFSDNSKFCSYDCNQVLCGQYFICCQRCQHFQPFVSNRVACSNNRKLNSVRHLLQPVQQLLYPVPALPNGAYMCRHFVISLNRSYRHTFCVMKWQKLKLFHITFRPYLTTTFNYRPGAYHLI